MTTRVLVGAPVRERAWILPTWLTAIDAQRVGDLEVDVCCFYEPGDTDDGTYDVLAGFGAAILRDDRLTSARSAQDIVDHRWDLSMYEHMAVMRNRIVAFAEHNRYDYLFALDTDVILHPDPAVAEARPSQVQLPDLPRLLDGLGPDDVVGPLVNMAKATPADPMPLAWNYMSWVDDPDAPRDPDGQSLWAQRPATDLCMNSGRHEVDVILAALLIPVRRGLPRWVAFPQGEDVGWPANARRAGLRLLVDTDIVCRHVMNPRPLDVPVPAG